MKITSKVLSIPPYLSTTWDNISTLRAKEESGTYHLFVLLKDGSQIEVPNLDKSTIHTIFDAHTHYFEDRMLESQSSKNDEETPISFSLPLKSDGEGTVIEAFGPATQHNPEQADLPPIPPGVLKKISAIASAFGVDSLPSLPKAEAGCNCIYCQVMNALCGTIDEEEEITEEDLRFCNWKVKETANKLYLVTNPIDSNEYYSVFLGEPIGCTCGQKNCEHICAVLQT